MSPAEQRHHAGGVLSRVVALRVALNEPERLMPKEAIMVTALALSDPIPALAAAAQSRRRLGPADAGVRKTTGRHWWAKLGRRSPGWHQAA